MLNLKAWKSIIKKVGADKIKFIYRNQNQKSNEKNLTIYRGTIRRNVNRRNDWRINKTIRTNPKHNKQMKVELIQKTTLTDMYYKIVVDGEFHMSYNDYDEAVRAYDKIKSAIPREEVILSKEI